MLEEEEGGGGQQASCLVAKQAVDFPQVQASNIIYNIIQVQWPLKIDIRWNLLIKDTFGTGLSLIICREVILFQR